MSDLPQASDCIFCRIASRQSPADMVHESDRMVAFRDINPKAPVHLLLVPKEHLTSVASLQEGHGDLLAEIIQAATHLARAEGVADSGWRLVTNVGSDAGQSVAHLHFHQLGGRPLAWPPG